MKVYAHSVPDADASQWELLTTHLAAVGETSALFASAFGWGAMAGLAGRLHDIGKCSAEFQQYIHKKRATGGDHSGAGAREVLNAGYPAPFAQMMAAIIAGHHAGLADCVDLDDRLRGTLPAYPGWDRYSGPLPPLATLVPTRALAKSPDPGFHGAFLTRMLFSCLVDADSLKTEKFYKGDVDRGPFLDLATLRDRLDAHMAALVQAAKSTELNALRAEVLARAKKQAELPPGLFTFTVPTGGGKTLASLSFALNHAIHHAKTHEFRRIVYVIPFTSIIEQTAEVFRHALGTRDDVLEHHASFDWEGAAARLFEDGTRDDEGGDPVARLHRAAENWDVPVIVTTAVQFFESLFSNKRSRCRKLHNLARSVIVLDEAQTLPLPLLRPCMAALDELARNYGSSVVLCTATQPALRESDGFARGLKIDDSREIAPDPKRLYQRLKRVRVERLPVPATDEMIAARFAEQPQMLCIVNSRKHARQLFALIESLPGGVHLTTLMCPLHRRAVLADLRHKLAAGEPVRLVATSLIEAGVDIDFPEVWRAAAGLDSVAQAAGRCNREGGPVLGRVVVFEPAEASAPRVIEQFWQAARPVLNRHADPLSLDAVHDYFRLLYWQKGADAFDAATLNKKVWPILREIGVRADTWKFPFAGIARAFRMIDEVMEPVVVPWKSHPGDQDAEMLLARVAAMERPLVADLRRLQLYTVSVPLKARHDWLTAGVLRPVCRSLGDAVLRFEGLSFYDPKTGLRPDEPTLLTNGALIA